MIKVVAKSPPEPAQVKLRESKKVWNKQVSEFADNLFRLKDMMNGKPSKFHAEKSSIKDPIPGDPVTIIGVLANDFQEISQKGNSIVQQQLEYSKNRRKKQPKQTLAPLPPQAQSPTDLTNQLANHFDDKLIVLGSNPLTRWFTRFLTPTMGSSPKARVRKYRMSLLKAAVDIYDDIVELQSTIVKSSPESIFLSTRLLNKIIHNWDFFKTGITTFDSNADVPEKETKNSKDPISSEEVGRTGPSENKDKKSPEVVKPTIKKTIAPSEIAKEYLSHTNDDNSPIVIINDYMKYSANFTDVNLKTLTGLITEYRLAPQNENTVLNLHPELAVKINREYKRILAELNGKYGTSGSSFKEILEAKLKKDGSANYELEVHSQKLVQKWLGRLKHEFLPVDKTSAHRLDIYKIADSLRKTVDKMMDSLEKTMDTAVLTSLHDAGTEELKTIKVLVDGLEKTLVGKGFNRPFMDMLDSGSITNFGPQLDDQQKKRLQTMIDRRRVKELADLYQGKQL
jgi:hypothetical protein